MIRGTCCDSCIRESSPPTIAPSETCGRRSSHARSRTAQRMSAARGHSKPSSAFSTPFASSTLLQPFRLSPDLSPLSPHPPEQRLLANQLRLGNSRAKGKRGADDLGGTAGVVMAFGGVPRVGFAQVIAHYSPGALGSDFRAVPSLSCLWIDRASGSR